MPLAHHPGPAEMLAVVTGASRGIGRATALRLAERGVGLALISKRGDGLFELADLLRKQGIIVLPLVCNVALESEVEAAAKRIQSELGVPHILVNNAGIAVRNLPVANTGTSDWDEVIAVNLRGPFLMTRAFLPAMLEQGRGRIVFVGSISSTIGCPGSAAYAASKWGVIGLSKSLAEELRDTGLQVVSVLPGSVDTDMLVGSGFKPRMSADDVAREIVHAALDAPAAIHGASIEMFA